MSCPEPLFHLSSVQQICSNIVSCFKLSRSVHPLEPAAPECSEFLDVSPGRRIRVIHVASNDGEKLQWKNGNGNGNVQRKSIRLSTEEYWFTRWNRPMRGTACNCSFRRPQRQSRNRYSLHMVFRIENYVEKLIGDIFLAAFKQYQHIMRDANHVTNDFVGVVNAAYEADKTTTQSVTLRKFNNNDGQIAYRKCESNTCRNEKPLVLLLHGIGSSAEVWWDVLQCLVCAGYEVLAPDMLGHGYSSVPDCPKAYTFPRMLKDALAVFDKYITSTESRKCIVIGHSYGCSLAGALARHREQQVVQLVLISGGGPTPLAPPVSDADVSLFACMQILIKPLLFCGVKRTAFYSSRGKHFETCEPQSETAVPPYVLRYISQGQHWPEGDAAFHRRILIPTLLVHGLQDKSVTLVQECEMERTMPRAFLEVIASAGHAVMIETPDQLCHMLLCFFQWWSK